MGNDLFETLSERLDDAGFTGDVTDDEQERQRVATDESIFSVMPAVVLAPKTRTDVELAVAVVAQLRQEGHEISLTPRAAGTGLSGGSLNDSVILDCERHLNTLGEPEAWEGNLFLYAEPGVYFRDIEKLLAPMTREVSVYPASKDICAVGGMVGNNAAGAPTLTYGHFVEVVESLDVVLADGQTYTLRPWTYGTLEEVMRHDNELARISREVWELIEAKWDDIQKARPKTKKNTAGYPLWDVIDTDPERFKAGDGYFNLVRLFCGSQGTLGVMTRATLETAPATLEQDLLIAPVFDLDTVGDVLQQLLTYEPFTLELFDDTTVELALRNPSFFKDRLSDEQYPAVLDALYRTYFDRYHKKVPAFVILASFTRPIDDGEKEVMLKDITARKPKGVPYFVTDPDESEMYWQVRRASYTLSKLQDQRKRPAAFLEDMLVPPQRLSAFFADLKKLFKKHQVQCAVHGHGGNGHLHFYPLLDFTDPATPEKVLKMADDFYATAIKHKGGLCGEHNDGIIRTPYLEKMYTKKALGLFRELEHIFDPEDIFNPGKKVNAKFDLKTAMRSVN
ncbi:FAD-binding protein [Patescibacteria group bacterium]|jgi:FAD/FMN-containing dehydrogenase|nr:FAD-binding protein [Patescibacteria group bacterium]